MATDTREFIEQYDQVYHEEIGVEQLSKDLKDGALKLTSGQARYLVDYYYKTQCGGGR